MSNVIELSDSELEQVSGGLNWTGDNVTSSNNVYVGIDGAGYADSGLMCMPYFQTLEEIDRMSDGGPLG